MRSIYVLLAVLFSAVSFAEELKTLGTVVIAGDITEPKQLSGAAFHGGRLFLCPDEGSTLNVLEKISETRFELRHTIQLKDESDVELDMEGLASDEKHVYVLGSHSLARKAVEDGRTYEKNLERLRDVSDNENKDRSHIYRLKLDADGALKSEKHISLRKLLGNDDILSRFATIPSKENGIDFEGIAVKDGKMFLGCRGPALRKNLVPVIVLDFEESNKYKLRFVDLHGRGIRDLVAVDDGFLLIAGPVGDGDASYQLYFWDGKDCVPGAGSPGGKVQLLGEVPRMGDDKAEGIAIVDEGNEKWRVLVIYDGVDTGLLVNVPRP